MRRLRVCWIASLSVIASIATPATAQSLDVVIGQALADSPTIEAAHAREDAALAAADRARAERGPVAAVSGQIGIGTIDPQGFFGLAAANVYPRTATAGVEMPLFTGGRTEAAIRAARLSADLARLRSQMAASELRVNIAAAYADGIAGGRMIEQYQALLETLTESVRQAVLKFQVGAATSTEVAQAEARLAEARGGFAGAVSDRAAAIARLGALVGKPVELARDFPSAPDVPTTRAAAIERALRENLGLNSAIQAVAIADSKRGGARAERLPTVGAYAEATTVRDQFFPGYKADSASIGLRARWTFFDNGQTSASVRGADAEWRAASADLASARLIVEQQAVTAFDQVETAKLIVTAAEARMTAAKSAQRGAGLEVSAGALPSIVALDAARESIAAEAALAAAQGRLLVAGYRLRAITAMDDPR